MKADRLVATLLFLQSRGRVTAAEVAAELEVSERTARRDLEALSAAGVPVYAQRGRGGGWALVGGARTDLSGLTAGEIRALFLVAGRSPVTPELRVALRKLVRALPATFRSEAETAARAVLTDPTDWAGAGADVDSPHLDALQHAVLAGTQVRLGYARPGEPAGERTVHPLGLADKAGVRYLVAGTERGLRTFRLSRVTSVAPTGEPVVRPEGFDLAEAWRSLTAPMEELMVTATVRARALRSAEAVLWRLFEGRMRIVGDLAAGPADAAGPAGPVGTAAAEEWMEITVDGPAPEVVAAQLAALGTRVEVLEPPEARRRLASLAVELAAMYGPPTEEGPDVAEGPGRPGKCVCRG